jgi:hypothetical protein
LSLSLGLTPVSWWWYPSQQGEAAATAEDAEAAGLLDAEASWHFPTATSLLRCALWCTAEQPMERAALADIEAALASAAQAEGMEEMLRRELRRHSQVCARV